jgi:hypothetical protein
LIQGRALRGPARIRLIIGLTLFVNGLGTYHNPAVNVPAGLQNRETRFASQPDRVLLHSTFRLSLKTTSQVSTCTSHWILQKLDSYNPTASLVKLFDEKNILYIAKWSDTDPNRLVGLVWTFPYCLRMWKRFPEVISFDNTYNTNRFKLPPFQVTGQTCLGSIYNAAFGLIDNERVEGFRFLASGIHSWLKSPTFVFLMWLSRTLIIR